MKIFFDTEFIDTGKEVHLLSIGMIREDNHVYYAEPAETDRSLACPWVNEHVIPLMNGPVLPRKLIRNQIVEFCGMRPQFWGYFVSYDWIVLSQLFGRMIDVPTHTKGWPNLAFDIQQLRSFLGGGILFPEHKGKKHNALDDAIWTKDSYYHMINMRKENYGNSW